MSFNQLNVVSVFSAEDVLKLIREKNIQIIDFRFTDLLGVWQHMSVPVSEMGEDINSGLWESGLGFDGSSIKGFQAINASDMNLIPDFSTAVVDENCKAPTLSIICNICHPLSLNRYNKDPRYIASKAENYLSLLGFGDISYWGPELEFFVFDDVQFDQNRHSGYYFIDSKEGMWNSGSEESPNLGYKVRHKGGYSPVSPTDSLQDLRTDIILALMRSGLAVEKHHHEVASAGQCEIDIRYNTLLKQADNVMLLKYIVKNVVLKHGKTVTFMPKPIFDDNGNGMHIHQSIFKGASNLFYDKDSNYFGLSDIARYYIGGLLKHSAAILSFAAPTTNSYKRLQPGFEAPVNLVYSAMNRSAICRIPVYQSGEKSTRVEYRSGDPTANPYLTFSAMLMAGLDGIQNKIDPGVPVDKNLFSMSKEELKDISTVPNSLDGAIRGLEEDHNFLLKGDVFTQDLLDSWINLKKQEIKEVEMRPHPWEFSLYFDA